MLTKRRDAHGSLDVGVGTWRVRLLGWLWLTGHRHEKTLRPWNHSKTFVLRNFHTVLEGANHTLKHGNKAVLMET